MVGHPSSNGKLPPRIDAGGGGGRCGWGRQGRRRRGSLCNCRHHVSATHVPTLATSLVASCADGIASEPLESVARDQHYRALVSPIAIAIATIAMTTIAITIAIAVRIGMDQLRTAIVDAVRVPKVRHASTIAPSDSPL